MPEPSTASTDEVLPPVAEKLFGLAWILLFAGRWIAVPFLLAARLVTPTFVADLDDRVLMRLYLVLLAATVLVAVLRAMRGAKQNGTPAEAIPPSEGAATSK